MLIPNSVSSIYLLNKEVNNINTTINDLSKSITLDRLSKIDILEKYCYVLHSIMLFRINSDIKSHQNLPRSIYNQIEIVWKHLVNLSEFDVAELAIETLQRLSSVLDELEGIKQ